MYTEQFGYYTNTDGNRQWNIAPGKFTVKIGASSQDIKLKQDITLTGDKQNKPLREFYFSETSVK
jgi:beta-glucosidase